MNFIAKICPAPYVTLFIVLSFFTVSTLGQDKIYVEEEVKIQNYDDAPLELQMVRTVTRPTDSEEWFATCFHYSIRNKTGMKLDNYSYEIINKEGRAYVMGGIFVKLKPFEFTQSSEQCVPNSVLEDEGPFIFRLIFIEFEHRTVWASEDHKKAVEKSFIDFRGISEEKEDGN
jgi:hypothetical protein